MSPSRFVKNAVFLCFLNVCLSYEHYTLSNDKLCSPVTKRRIRIRREAESAVIVRETRSFDGWQGVVQYTCRFEIKSSSGDGVIAVIQNLSFRSDESGCIDYIEFKREDGSKSKRFCGQITAFKQSRDDDEMQASFFDPKGELDTTIFVENRKLKPHEKLDLEIVYSSFRECRNGRVGYDSCGPEASDICIWRGLFNDSFVNCPKNCFDEGSCVKNLGDSKESDVGTKVTVGAVATIILAFILFFTCLWLLRRNGKLCWSSDCSSASRPTPPASRVEMHPHLQDEEIATFPTPSAPSQAQESASVTISQDKDLPPSYDSLFPGR